MRKRYMNSQQTNILWLLMDGVSSDEIAQRTAQNPSEVKEQVEQIMQMINSIVLQQPIPMPAGSTR